MHHIISDGWSSGFLINELGQLYNAFDHGQPPPLADLAIQYGDYALWEQEWLSGEVVSRQLEYWKQQLKGASDVIELPTDRPRPAVQSFHGARQYLKLSGEVCDGLKRLC